MKKLVLFAFVSICSLAASAQYSVPFSIYRPANTYENNSSNNNRFNFDDPASNYRPPQQQRSQIYSIRGYYKENNQWASIPIKVQERGHRVYVVVIKLPLFGWSNINIPAESTDYMISCEIKDNFDYYFTYRNYGKICF